MPLPILIMQLRVKNEGGKILYGGETLSGDGYESGCYVMPCIAEVEKNLPIVCDKTLPLLYIMKYNTIDEAIAFQNDVPQGLSSSIFSRNMLETKITLFA